MILDPGYVQIAKVEFVKCRCHLGLEKPKSKSNMP